MTVMGKQFHCEQLVLCNTSDQEVSHMTKGVGRDRDDLQVKGLVYGAATDPVGIRSSEGS